MHNHLPNFARREILETKEKICERAQIGTEKPRKIILGYFKLRMNIICIKNVIYF